MSDDVHVAVLHTESGSPAWLLQQEPQCAGLSRTWGEQKRGRPWRKSVLLVDSLPSPSPYPSFVKLRLLNVFLVVRGMSMRAGWRAELIIV